MMKQYAGDATACGAAAARARVCAFAGWSAVM